MSEQKVETTKGLGCTLGSGSKVDGYLNGDSSIFWIFTSKDGTRTRVLLSIDAVSAMGQIANELMDPKEPAA